MDDQRFIYSFEKLDVWKESKSLATCLYKLTESFPENEKFGIINQIRRAAISVSANIAEGSAKYSKKDFSRFLQISYGSLMEILSHLFISKELDYISDNVLDNLIKKIQSISNIINSLNKSISIK